MTTKAQFLSKFATDNNRDEMEWWLEDYAKEVLEDNAVFIVSEN